MKKQKSRHYLGVIPFHWGKSILALLFIFFYQSVFAQTYIPLNLTGYNTDAIVDNGETPSSSGYLDKASNGYTYYSKAHKTAGGLDQSFVSSGGVAYTLASFTSNNVLKLSPVSENGVQSATLTLASPLKTNEIWILGTATEANTTAKIIVHYDDNTTTEDSKEFKDWYSGDGNGTAVHGLQRIRVTNSTYDTRSNFSLYERLVLADKTKNVTSVEFKVDDGKFLSIFAISVLDENTPMTAKTLYMIPNSHLDTQWNWTVETSIDQYVKNTLEGNFALFEKYPDYKFNFEGAIKYMFAKEYYPELYEKLKGYIAAGRWNISGGSVDANDVMVPSSESIIRNFLYGQEFYKKEFGVKGGTDFMLPDCFGFPYTLPTLAKHAGVTGFHTAKLGWGSAYPLENLPNFGKWKGVDGSEIIAVYKPQAYDAHEGYRKDMSMDSGIYSEIETNKAQGGVSSAFRYVGNRGDRGGSLDDETVDWLVKSTNSGGPITVKLATPTEFFESITPSQMTTLPTWNNELPMETHGVGCYTSQAILKYWNRKNELLADATEKSSTLAHWLGGLPYQSKPIRNSWINVLWHQFHDDLPGTSLPQAYNFTYNDQVLAQINLSKTNNNAVGAIARQMDTNVDGIPIVVSNPLSIEREDVVEVSIPLETEPSAISVYDPSGTVVAAQKNGYKDGKLSLLFLAKAPSLGYATYNLKLEDNASASVATSLSITANTIENDEYKITVDANGDVSSIIDKKQGNIELLKTPIRQSLSLDQPGYWMAWEISRGDIERAPYGYVGDNAIVSIAENGPLRASLKVTRSATKDRETDVPSTYRASDYVQYIQLSSHGSKDRIDFVNEIDWQTTETFLKAEFDLNATNEKATFDLSIGTIDRKTRQIGDRLYEVAGHQWADVTHNDNSYGVSILNDCKYGWDKATDNKLRLTLIHTPKDGGNYSYHKNQDLGLNKFTYSFYRHMGKWNEDTQWEAAKLNQPMIAYQAPKHAGTLGKSFEFVSLNTDKVAVKTLKKAESSDNMIVRVYELVGESHNNVEIQFPANIVSAKEVNGIEEEVGAVTVSGNKLVFDINKYQPKTFSVQLATASATINAPSSSAVSLTYDVDIMSSDAIKTDGEFGNAPYLYPAELLADEIEADGVKFTIGSRADGSKNALLAKGQEIAIPQNSANKKVYVLAASKNPRGSKVYFGIDGVAKEEKVDYYAGYVGQWGSMYANQDYVKSDVAFTATHRHNIKDNKNDAYHYLHIYKYVIDIDANAQTLTLPNDPDVLIFAITVSDNANDDVAPVNAVADLPSFETIESLESQPVGQALYPSSFEASGFTKESEGPQSAADNNPLSKWCDNSSANKWLQYNFDEPVKISQWNVLHAGIEDQDKITSEFRLQRYDVATSTWVNVDVVTNNKQSVLGNFRANKTIRKVTPFVTTKVRLAVDRGEVENNVARIHEFAVYGEPVLADDDATLASLTVSRGTLTPNFDPQTFVYSVTVGESISSIEIGATTTHAKATVDGIGEKDNLVTGDNVFDVVVTAKDGLTTKTYKVTVVRTASAEASLKSLEVSNGILTPVFNANTLAYSVSIPNDLTSITITGEAKDDNATLTGIGLKENLVLGDNVFDIVVTAQDGVTTQTYKVTVTRRILSDDASLDNVTINGTLWQDLSAVYDMGCDDELSITITPTDPLSVVSIGNNYSETITTGTLKDIPFTITSESGTVENYVLKIERRYAFDDIIAVKWNNTLMTDLKRLRLDGFHVTSYQWYKDGSALKGATSATYSAGTSKVDWLEKNSTYHLEMLTTQGKLHTCAQKPNLKTMTLKAYPNPALQGEMVYLDADIDDSLLIDASIDVYTLSGNKISSHKVSGRMTELVLPSSQGTYLLKFVSKDGYTKDLKVIIK